jgi:hypothetical protein
MKKKIIAICCSANFYKQALEIEKELQVMGFLVRLPFVARRMARSGDFRVSTYKTWFKDSRDYVKKAALIKKHFQEIRKSDAILVLNYEKKGIKGYIGGNTLIEMALAFHYKKPIYILNEVNKKLSYLEEIFALAPIILAANLKKIKKLA